MLPHVLAGISLLAICFGESSTNQAVSSQSYEREDVPLSYKHNILHIYSTPKSNEFWNRNKDNYKQDESQPQNNYKQIQYAPLALDNQEDLPKGTLYIKPNIDYNEKNKNIDVKSYLHLANPKKTHLEPQLLPTERNFVRPHFVQYVAGHNIINTNNNPVNKGLLVNSADGIMKKRPIINFFQPQVVHQIPKIQSTPQSIEVNSLPEYVKSNQAYSLLGHKYIQDNKIYNGEVLTDKEKVELQPMVYVKAPKLQLNVARAYSIARTPYKASINEIAYRKLPSVPQNSQSEPQIAQSANTQLHPVQNRNLYIFHRST